MSYDDEIQKGLLDFLSSSAQHQSKTNVLLQRILDNLKGGASPAIQTNISLKAQLENGNLIPYQLITIPMGTAGVDVPYSIDLGGNLVAASDGSLAGVTIKLGTPSNGAIPLLYFVGTQVPVSKVYISWPSQFGKTLYILIGMPDVAQFNVSATGAMLSGTAGLQTLFSGGFAALPAGTYYSSWLNLTAGQRAVIFITNTLDQPITINTIGNISQVVLPAGGFVYKGLSVIAIALTGIKEIGISDVYWDPYIAVEIVQPGVVTVGGLLIQAVVQG
jgi:hypothetical protein